MLFNNRLCFAASAIEDSNGIAAAFNIRARFLPITAMPTTPICGLSINIQIARKRSIYLSRREKYPATQIDKHTTAIIPSMTAMVISPALPIARVAG